MNYTVSFLWINLSNKQLFSNVITGVSSVFDSQIFKEK